MTNKIYFYNAATGEEIIRDMTVAEQKKRDAEIGEWQKNQEIEKEKNANNRAVKISAYKKLGLTDEEIEALLPNENPQPIFNNA